jgi:ABC-type branched-subunit amino acid transport system ATPase component
MLLRVEGLSISFGGVEALSEVDLALAPGERLGLMGPNGCGKTTLFNAISGVVRPLEGRIVFDGHDITGRPVHTIARHGIARTFQTVRLFERMTVLDNVAPSATATDSDLVARVLELVNLAPKCHLLAGELSLGEQRRLELARALARSPRLMLMDEPTAGLNPQETDEMVALIDAALPATQALILIEHKPEVVAALCSVATLLVQGRKTMQAPPGELFASANFRTAYLGTAGRHTPDTNVARGPVDPEGGARR